MTQREGEGPQEGTSRQVQQRQRRNRRYQRSRYANQTRPAGQRDRRDQSSNRGRRTQDGTTHNRQQNQEQRNHKEQQRRNQQNNQQNNQQRRQQRERDERLNEAIGDDIHKKEPNILRIATWNAGGLPVFNKDKKGKNDRIREAINEYRIDVLGIQEPNKNWNLIDQEHRWDERTKHWWEARHNTIAFNKHDVDSTRTQPGGTILLTINKAVYRAMQREIDPKGLGRWASTLYRGKQNIKTRIVTAYRPVKSGQVGSSTTYRQQQRAYNKHNKEDDPRDAFLQDLGNQIQRWKNAGEQVILLMDANDDVRGNKIRTWAQANGLIERLNQEGDPTVATHNRGSKPIDGIFTTEGIDIVKRGYLAHGDMPSDHRLGFIDIRYITAFGHKMEPINIPGARRLKTDDPRILNRWIKCYEKLIKKSKLHQRVYDLEQKVNNRPEGTDLTQEEKRNFDKIIKERKKYIEIADRRCRKLYMSNIACTPELDKTKKLIQLIEGTITRKKGARFSLTKIKRLERKVNHYNFHLLTMDELNRKLEAAKRKKFHEDKTADQRRETYLEQKAAAVAEDKDVDKQTMYGTMLDREKTRNSHRKINHALGKTRQAGLTKVVVEQNDETVDVTEKEAIEEACMEENNSKYHQTESTPCMQEPLRSLLGEVGETEFAQTILLGTFHVPEGTNPYVSELFKELKMVDLEEDQKPKAEVTSEDFRTGWKKMKEQTSAGISGLHFGHLKACAKNTFLCQVESCISHIPYRSGYSPPGWQQGLDVMLLKKGKSELVTALRTIVLCEADFNFNNKLLGKIAIAHAEKHNLLPNEQYGSRAGKSAIDHALHKRLWYDTLRLTRRQGIMCSNDAKSCYDRIIHSVAALAYKRIGIPDPPVHCMFRTIQNMRHHIRTAYGDSAFFMDCSGLDIKYQGVLQGNGASPTTWALVSTPVINMLRTANEGTHITTAIREEEIHIVGFAFVDDTDLPVTNTTQVETIEEVRDKAQSCINRWEGGIKATGGAIRPDKSFVQPVAFEFNPEGEYKYRTANDINIELSVQDHTDTVQPLEVKDPSDAECTLGVYLAPDGNNDIQKEKLREKTEAWADHIRTGHIRKEDALRAMNTTIVRTVSYAVPALTLSKKECATIMAPVMHSGLNAMGISRNFPCDLRHGSKKEGGIELLDIYIEQGVSQIYYVIKHLEHNNMTGQFLRTTLEAAIIEMGILSNLFDLDYERFECLLSPCWIKNVWKFIDEHDLRIEQKVIPKIPKEREEDLSIMQALVESGHFKKRELRQANRCRWYLQVTTLSQIVDGYGEQFTRAIKCERDTTRTIRHNWPYQPYPGIKARRAWKRLLKRKFINNERIQHDLGRFYKPEDENTWKWYIQNQEPRNIYEKRGQRIKVWKRAHPQGPPGRRPLYRYFQDGHSIPNSAKMATIEKAPQQKIRLTGYTDNLDTRYNRTPSKDWGDPRILEEAEMPTAELKARLRQAILDRKLRIVSDGSYYREHNIGAAGWVIDDGERVLLRGRSRVPGGGKIHSSYRSELYGLLCGVLHTAKIFQYEDITGTIDLACDGEGATKAINRRYDISDPARKHHDIIDSIWKTMDESGFQWNLIHVDGHQDDHTPFAELPRLAQLNVLADNLAKAKSIQLIETNDLSQVDYRLPFQKTRLIRNGYSITGEIKKTIHDSIARQRARNYWKKKFHITPELDQIIDWELWNKSHSSFKKNHWLSKWLSGWCGVGKQLKRYKHQEFTNCPRCDNPDETTEHILRCQDAESNNLWEAETEKLKQWLTDNDCEPHMKNYIIASLTAWRNNTPYPDVPDDETLSRAAEQQQQLTWKGFLNGCLSKHWRIAQQNYLDTKRSSKSSLLWASRLQHQVWMLQWNLWEKRNDFIHNQNDKVHPREAAHLREAILEEWIMNDEGLTEEYHCLLTGTLQERLDSSHVQQQQWLTSIWLARLQTDGTLNHIAPANTALIRFRKWMKIRHTR